MGLGGGGRWANQNYPERRLTSERLSRTGASVVSLTVAAARCCLLIAEAGGRERERAQTGKRKKTPRQRGETRLDLPPAMRRWLPWALLSLATILVLLAVATAGGGADAPASRARCHAADFNARRPLNVVWHYSGVAYEDYFWTRALLSRVGRPLRVWFDITGELAMNDSLVFVDYRKNTPDPGLYWRQARERGLTNLGVFVTGDEHNQFPKGIYTQASVDFVLRNYYFAENHSRARFGALPVVWVPNGYRTGVGPIHRALPAHLRSVVVSWFGSLRGPRAEILRLARASLDSAGITHDFAVFSGFGGELPPLEYAARVENSQFCLVPPGNNVETIRLYDCLEAGTIPVVQEAEYLGSDGPLAGHPFLVVRNGTEGWAGIHRLLRPFLAAPERLLAKQQSVVQFWRRTIADKALEISGILDASFARAHGDPC